MLTKANLKKLFDYQDGRLVKLYRKGRGRSGRANGTIRTDGYRAVMIDYKLYLEHRLIFQWHHGNRMPKQIDHIDGNRLNNRIENLRGCANQQNSWNAKISRRNKSGFKGVTWNEDRQKWRAGIRCGDKNLYLGRFDFKEDAARAYDIAARKHFGEFAYLNFPDER